MNKIYYPTIGLEIHAELKTKSKMFCGCKNNPDEIEPNVNICPVCMAHPGTLPVANKKAIQSVITVGLAVGADIADFTEFDRKHYFYPDIPKGYQLSQYKYPIVSGGTLNGVVITRVHIEEDTATSKHDRGAFTLVDYNRAGVPLMELVTEPVIKNAEQAGAFARELQLLLRTLDVSHANMEKGEMRVEANISLSDDSETYGTKVEVKNLNSFKSVEKAIAYELSRMQALYEAGRESEIVQETRGWDEVKLATFSQRSKENANDYRYFPDPDIPKMQLHAAFNLEEMKKVLPELPWNKRSRYMSLGLSEADASILVVYPEKAALFEAHLALLTDQKYAKRIANVVLNDITTIAPTSIATSAEIIVMAEAGDITSRGAKDIYTALMAGEAMHSVRAYAESHGLLQEHDEGALKPIIEDVIKQNEKMVADYKAGKEAALQGLVGQVMKASKGSANPRIAMKLLKELLG